LWRDVRRWRGLRMSGCMHSNGSGQSS